MPRGAGKAIMRTKTVASFFWWGKKDSSSYFEREKEKQYLTESFNTAVKIETISKIPDKEDKVGSLADQ